MASTVEITNHGIKQLLRKHTPESSIAEYIWNGFDARATKVDLSYDKSGLGYITELSVCDNGEGILPSALGNKFRPFFQSNKVVELENPKNHSIPKGKQGVGRLTFFTFANHATWITQAFDGDTLVKLCVKVNGNDIKNFTEQTEFADSQGTQGTLVTFTNIDEVSQEVFDSEIVPYLQAEFAWFLDLNKDRLFSITINGVPLDYSSLILESDDFTRTIGQNKKLFRFRFRAWKSKLNREYSKYYFINSRGEEVWKCNTTLNNKGDNFYHSLYVQSEFFDGFYWDQQEAEDGQDELFLTQKHPAFKELMSFMSRYLYNKRAPYIEEFTKRLIATYEDENVFPTFAISAIGKLEKTLLENTVRELYKVEPKIFSGLNLQQKKAFIELLNTMLEMGANDKLLEIVAAVARMTPQERDEFADILQFANISSITRTIGMLRDRCQTIIQLKELVYNKELRANERDHLQKLLEKHYWLFGEQYTLVTAEEPDFEEALRRYQYILTGDSSKIKMSSPEKNKEMDIFCCKKNIHRNTVESIIVELKHPEINLSTKELGQVKEYMRIIMNEDRFNGSNHHWTFYLVGNGYSADGAIEAELESNKNHGEPSLVFKVGNYRIYVKRWSEIFDDFECRYNYLLEKLEFDKASLLSASKLPTADAIVADARQNQAMESANYEHPR